MASEIEVEIKFRIEDIPELETRLRSSGFHLVTERTHEFNTLYDLPGDPLRSRGDLLRIRRYGSRWTVTFKSKGKTDRYKTRTEIETQVEDGAVLSRMLEAVSFQPTFAYEKFRTEWGDGRGHVVIDQTPIGDFGEIEGAPDWIDSTAHLLGLHTNQYITESYALLFFKWKQQTGSSARDMLFKQG